MAMPGAIRMGGNAQFNAGVVGGVIPGVPGGAPGAGLTLMENNMGRASTTLGTGNAPSIVLATNLSLKRDAAPAAHVRSYFPEALYINPEIITDKMAAPAFDSDGGLHYHWRMAMIASTQHGALGSGTSSLKVFQDFFVDLDLPVTLTQGDRVSIPGGRLQLLGHNRETSTCTCSRRLVLADRTTRPRSRSQSILTAWEAHSSLWKPSASGNSSSRLRPV